MFFFWVEEAHPHTHYFWISVGSGNGGKAMRSLILFAPLPRKTPNKTGVNDPPEKWESRKLKTRDVAISIHQFSWLRPHLGQ